MKSILLALILVCVSSVSWAEPQMEMHRLQATTQDPSGWYFAASTKGSFSILMPIPFNDFTVNVDDPKVGKVHAYAIGSKSAEGIKFSAMETPIVKERPPANLAGMAEEFRKPGQTVSEVDTSPFAGYPSASFSIKGPTSGAYIRYVKTPKSLVAVVLEYPNDQAKAAERLQASFLASLKIKQAAPDGTASGRPPDSAKIK